MGAPRFNRGKGRRYDWGEKGYTKKYQGKIWGCVQLRWLYLFDLFFWYLQKVSLSLILIWLARSWWQGRHSLKEDKPED